MWSVLCVLSLVLLLLSVSVFFFPPVTPLTVCDPSSCPHLLLLPSAPLFGPAKDGVVTTVDKWCEVWIVTEL